MTQRSAMVGFLCVLLLGAGAWGGWAYFARRASPPPPPPPPPEPASWADDVPPSAAVDQPLAAPAVAVEVPRMEFQGRPVRPVAAPLGDPATSDGHIRLPDGRFMPNLNGVSSSDTLRWGAAPFPGIVGKVTNPADGLEWYLLGNGDLLTTANLPGTDNGQTVHRDLILHLQKKDIVPHHAAGPLIPMTEGRTP